MARSIIVPGTATIKVNTGSAGALETLGVTINGARIEEEVLTVPVPSDENGGDEGPPLDFQYLGEIHRVSLELVSYDMAVLAKVLAQKGGTEGQQLTAGTLLSSGGYTFRLLIHTTNNPRNYLAAVLRGPAKGCNRGTRFAVQTLNFECYASAGVLYNTTTS